MEYIDGRLRWDKRYKAELAENEIEDNRYGLAVFDCAKKWAEEMEKYEDDEGGISIENMKKIADECRHKAYLDIGITGFQHECVVNLLATTWRHAPNFILYCVGVGDLRVD